MKPPSFRLETGLGSLYVVTIPCVKKKKTTRQERPQYSLLSARHFSVNWSGVWRLKRQQVPEKKMMSHTKVAIKPESSAGVALIFGSSSSVSGAARRRASGA